MRTKSTFGTQLLAATPDPAAAASRSNRSVSLMDRMNQLQNAQNSWQSKVVEKDAGKFTVAGKMSIASSGNNTIASRSSVTAGLKTPVTPSEVKTPPTVTSPNAAVPPSTLSIPSAAPRTPKPMTFKTR